VASANGKLYAGGGMSGRTPGEWQETASLYEFNPAMQTWMEKSPMPTARGEHLAITFNGKIYFIGGRFDTGQDSDANEVYDPQTDTWQSRAPMPTPRRSFAAVALDSLIYVIGGRRQLDGGFPNLVTVEAYAPASDKWYQLADLPTARGALAVGTLNGNLYAMGGEFFTGVGGVFNKNEVYDPGTDSWSSATKMSSPVHGTGAVTIGETIYLVGGAKRVAVFSSGTAQGFVVRQ